MNIASKYAAVATVTANPPEAAVEAGTEASPLQEAIRASRDQKAWLSYQNVPSTPTITFPARGRRPETVFSEADILSTELKRAARQLGCLIKVKLAEVDGTPDVQHVFFLAKARPSKPAETPATPDASAADSPATDTPDSANTDTPESDGPANDPPTDNTDPARALAKSRK